MKIQGLYILETLSSEREVSERDRRGLCRHDLSPHTTHSLIHRSTHCGTALLTLTS